MRPGVNHETFVIPGLVDGAVAMAQAEKRRDYNGEVTFVHFHKDGEDCNPKCRLVSNKEKA